MKLNNPKCSRGHPLATMRLELQEGCYMRYRCPECWHGENVFEIEPLDELPFRDKYAAIFDAMVLHTLKDWTRPIQMKVDKINPDRTFELIFRNA